MSNPTSPSEELPHNMGDALAAVGIIFAFPEDDRLVDALSDAAYAIGARRARLPFQLSCQLCGARPGYGCLNRDGSAYSGADDGIHQSRWRAYLRLPNRE